MNAAVPESGGGLYAAHEKIYPREVRGRFENLRTASVLVLLGLFYGMPWLKWDGRQALLFDLPARKFYIFSWIFLPQDFYLLTWLLIIAALSLFFFTALAGRLWCGYACPQTVWTTAFVWMERLVEGSRAQRIKLDRAPMSASKFLRKTAKQTMWLTFALWTGFTFVGFFSPIRGLFAGASTLTLGPWETFWVLFYGFATYGNAGFMREQVCKYMCPYARFQSAMFDRHTLVISYDTERGEPRGARARGVDHRSKGLGDCIDCTLCVQACPTGIDIRKGLQYECIACAACIDACDSVMDKMNYPRGLVRYSTQAMIEGDATRILRPRTAIYAVLLVTLILGFGYVVTHRNRVGLDVLRDRNALYRQLNDGRIENVYTVRIINKDTRSHEFSLSVDDLPGAEIDSDKPTYTVSAAEVRSVAVRVRVPARAIVGGHSIELKIDAIDAPDISTEAKARFYAPRE
jgi:cytochrome c oxidase accessory protein FixG